MVRVIHISLVLLFLPLYGVAQQPNNPLVQLMMSQPDIDVSAPVVAKAVFDPPVVKLGEAAMYRVTVNAMQASIRWPGEIPAPDNMEMQRTSQGELLLSADGRMQPMTAFNFTARPKAMGFYGIPEFVIEVGGKAVVVPGARLEVLRNPPPPYEPARRVTLEVSSTNVFLGEKFTARVMARNLSTNILQQLQQVQFNGDGFVTDKDTARQLVQAVARPGGMANAFVYETSLTPIATGDLEISAQAFTGAGFAGSFNGTVIIQGSAILPGGPQAITLLDSDPVKVRVKPLPADSELPGFTGILTDVTCDPPQLSTNTVAVGDPVQLRVVLRTADRVTRIVPPPPPRAPGWQILPAAPGGLVGGGGGLNVGTLFLYTMIPTRTDITGTPEIPFSRFDPQRVKYVDMTIPSLPIRVLPAENDSSAGATVSLPERTSDDEAPLTLSNLATSPGRSASSLVPVQLRAWFPAMQLSPALLFGGLWIWDRRRRHLEAHPEIVRRRRALRALRREQRNIRRAAARSDARKFVEHAIAAMQAVCAPHYPAEPRALVGGDVLNCLLESDRSTLAGQTVRRFFAVADAERFAVSATIAEELLSLSPGLDSTLAKLEARL